MAYNRSKPKTSKSSNPKPKKTSFVPRTIFMTALSSVSVIPVCACGGNVSSPNLPSVAAIGFDGGDGGKKKGDSGHPFGVAADAFQGVAVIGFDAGDAGLGVADRAFSVADVGFADAGDAQFGVAADAFIEASDAPFGVAADAFSHDAPLGVAFPGFDGGNGGH